MMMSVLNIRNGQVPRFLGPLAGKLRLEKVRRQDRIPPWQLSLSYAEQRCGVILEECEVRDESRE